MVSKVPQNIPPIILNWVENMNSGTIKEHARDNYCLMLENVSEYILNEIKKHKNTKTKNVKFNLPKRK